MHSLSTVDVDLWERLSDSQVVKDSLSLIPDPVVVCLASSPTPQVSIAQGKFKKPKIEMPWVICGSKCHSFLSFAT